MGYKQKIKSSTTGGNYFNKLTNISQGYKNINFTLSSQELNFEDIKLELTGTTKYFTKLPYVVDVNISEINKYNFYAIPYEKYEDNLPIYGNLTRTFYLPDNDLIRMDSDKHTITVTYNDEGTYNNDIVYVKVKLISSTDTTKILEIYNFNIALGSNKNINFLFIPNLEDIYDTILFEIERSIIDTLIVNAQDLNKRIYTGRHLSINNYLILKLIDLVGSVSNYWSLIGILADPGTVFVLNNEDFIIGKSGIFETNYQNLHINNMYIYLKENSQCIIDYYEETET